MQRSLTSFNDEVENDKDGYTWTPEESYQRSCNTEFPWQDSRYYESQHTSVYTNRSLYDIRNLIRSGDAVLCLWSGSFGKFVRFGMRAAQEESSAFVHIGIFVWRRDLPAQSHVAPPMGSAVTMDDTVSTNDDLYIFDTATMMPSYVDARWSDISNGAQLRRAETVMADSEVCAWLPLNIGIRLASYLTPQTLEAVLCKYQGTPYRVDPLGFASVVVPELRPARQAVDASLSSLIVACCPNSWCSTIFFGNGRQHVLQSPQQDTRATSEAAIYGYRAAMRDLQGEKHIKRKGKKIAKKNYEKQRRMLLCQGDDDDGEDDAPNWAVCSELVARIYTDLGIFGRNRFDCATVEPCDFLPDGYGDYPIDMLDCSHVIQTCDRDRLVPWVFSQVVLFNQ